MSGKDLRSNKAHLVQQLLQLTRFMSNFSQVKEAEHEKVGLTYRNHGVLLVKKVEERSN